MKASFDKEEMMAGLAELEKRVREHRSHGPLAASPDSRLDLDLAAIEAAVRSKSAAKPATADNAGLSVEFSRDQFARTPSVTLDVVPERELSASAGKPLDVAAPDLSRERIASSRAAAIDVLAEKEPRAPAAGRASPPPVPNAKRPGNVDAIPEKKLPASDTGTESAPSRPHRWIYAAAAIVIVIGSLLGGAGYVAGGKVFAALRSPSAPQKIDPSPEATAASPAPEATADVGAATPPATEDAAALRGGEAAPAPEPATQAATADTGLAAPAGAAAAANASPPPAAAPPPAAEKAASVTEPPPVSAAAPSDAKPAKPAKKPKKPTADKSDKDSKAKPHAKDKPEKVAKPHPAPEASTPPPAPARPQALAEPPPPPPPPPTPEPGVLGKASQAVGSITGTVKGWVGLDSGAH